ncbi:MAG: DUF2442 domain-containing protein [Clostridia bacterium]|nr:DUF2442 domain-containing protein [Clostridia bacterium]
MKTLYDETLNDYICIGDEELINVTAVEPSPDYSLALTFSNGEKRLFNFLPLLDRGLFRILKNKTLFMSAHVGCGTVVWNDDIDIAPERLYAESRLLP